MSPLRTIRLPLDPADVVDVLVSIRRLAEPALGTPCVISAGECYAPGTITGADGKTVAASPRAVSMSSVIERESARCRRFSPDNYESLGESGGAQIPSPLPHPLPQSNLS